MSTRARYHPRDIDIDLADLPRWLYNEIASLHGQIDPPPAAPVLTCLGNSQPMYVWHHANGRYFARHYQGGNPNGHRHLIATMSDEHRRQAEYGWRAATQHGLEAQLEKSTGNGTRLDVAITGNQTIGLEVQRSLLSRAHAKRRATLSLQAGWSTAWIHDKQREPDWANHVPTARLETRGWDELPPPNSVHVIIGEFRLERDHWSRTGYRYIRTPKAIPLDELSYLMPAGDIIPVAVGKRGRVDLASPAARRIIDSCTYDGASVWRPNMKTPRFQEAIQNKTLTCHQPLPKFSDDCRYCLKPLWAPQSVIRGYCEECHLYRLNMGLQRLQHDAIRVGSEG